MEGTTGIPSRESQSVNPSCNLNAEAPIENKSVDEMCRVKLVGHDPTLKGHRRSIVNYASVNINITFAFVRQGWTVYYSNPIKRVPYPNVEKQRELESANGTGKQEPSSGAVSSPARVLSWTRQRSCQWNTRRTSTVKPGVRFWHSAVPSAG